jgi:hypothetical protein
MKHLPFQLNFQDNTHALLRFFIQKPGTPQRFQIFYVLLMDSSTSNILHLFL